jgi:hypothetical protein
MLDSSSTIKMLARLRYLPRGRDSSGYSVVSPT